MGVLTKTSSRSAVALRTPLWFYVLSPQKVGEGIFSTLIPLFVTQVIGGTVADVGRVTSATAIAAVPGAIFWGNISDHLQRRRVFLLLGFFGFAVSILLMGLAQSLPAVLWTALLGGALGSAIGPVAMAFVVDRISPDSLPEAFGRLNRINGLSFVSGLVLGTLWLAVFPRLLGDGLAMRGLLFVAASVASLSLLLTALWVPEPPKVQPRRRFHPALVGRLVVAMAERALLYPPHMVYFVLRPAFLQEVRAYLRSTLGQYYLCAFLLFFAIHVGFVPFPVFLAQELNASGAEVFLVSLLKSGADTLFYVPMARVIQRRRGIGLQAQAAAVRVGIFLVFTGLAWWHPGRMGLPIAAFVHIFTGITWAAIAVSGTTAVAVLAPKGLEGRAMGLYNAVIGISGIAGSLAGGYLAHTWGYTFSFLVAALFMGLAAVWLWQFRAAVPIAASQRT